MIAVTIFIGLTFVRMTTTHHVDVTAGDEEEVLYEDSLAWEPISIDLPSREAINAVLEQTLRMEEERAVALVAAEEEEARRQAAIAAAWAAEQQARIERARSEWLSVPAGQHLANAARPMLVDRWSAYANAYHGPTPLASINGNYLHARRTIGAIGSTTDCGSFLATVVRYSGVDPLFPRLTTGLMMSHMDRSPRWQEVANTGNPGSLQPGDVFVNVQHIFVFLGGTTAAHSRLGWALPYAFDIMTPFWRADHWPPGDSSEWANFPESEITIEERMASGGQFRDGIWANSIGPYRIFRPAHI
jgi:hypothetical protein